MAASNEPEWKGYTSQLLADKKEETIAIPDTEEKGATAIRRHPIAKDGFLMFKTDEDMKVKTQSRFSYENECE